MYGFSNVVDILSLSVTKYGDLKPRSNCIPSTTSSDVSPVLLSSTVTTPSLPTALIASAIILPTVSSLLAEIVATCCIGSSPATSLLIPFSVDTTCITALSIPLLSSIGLPPDDTRLKPSSIIA